MCEGVRAGITNLAGDREYLISLRLSGEIFRTRRLAFLGLYG